MFMNIILIGVLNMKINHISKKKNFLFMIVGVCFTVCSIIFLFKAFLITMIF